MAVKPGNGGAQQGNGERDPRLDLLYRAAPRETPPAHLDAAILAAARREVGARPRPLATQLRRWRVPVSIAAVVVLSVSLVSLIREEEGGDTLMRDARSPAVPPVARTAEPPAQPAEPAEARQRAPAAAPEPFSARRDERAAKVTAELQKVEKEATPGVGPAARQGTRAAPAPEADSRMLARPMQDAPRAVEERAAAPQSAAPERREQPLAGAAQRSAPETGAPGAAPQAKPKPMASRMQAEQALAMKRLPAWDGLEQEQPQKWLERLAELRRQKRTGEADELLAEFKRRFPDHPLPSGLE